MTPIALMSTMQTFNRAQYLQQRRASAPGLWESIGGLVLLLAPTIALVRVLRSDSQNFLLQFEPPWRFILCLTAAIPGSLWLCVQTFRQKKRMAIHCPSCRRDNSGYSHLRMLIASGRCVFCDHPIFSKDEVVSSPPPFVKTVYAERLKHAEAHCTRAALIGVLPLLGFLIWNAWNENYLLFEEREAWFLTAIVASTVLALAVMIAAAIRTHQNFPTNCLICHTSALWNPLAAKATLATGHCSYCGALLFQSDPAHGT